MHAVRTYLELRRPPDAEHGPPAVPPPLVLRRVARPTAAEYRALYAAVGRDYQWRDRDAWSDARLGRHLADPAVALWVLEHGGTLAGYFELVRREAARDGSSGGPPASTDTTEVEVELLYFGLTPAFLGRGLGRLLLERAVAEAWALGADRLVLNTCTLDHPAALPNYLARGFRVVRAETYEVTAPQP